MNDIEKRVAGNFFKSVTAAGYNTMTIEVKIHTPLTFRSNPKMLASQVDKRLGQIMRGTPVKISNIIVKDFTDEEVVLAIDFYSDPDEVMKALRSLKLATKSITARGRFYIEFYSDGKRKRKFYETLEDAREVADKIFRETGILVGIQEK